MRGCTSSTLIPLNLYTSREARQEALLSYSLSFNLPHCNAKIFFNAVHDVLYFGPGKDSIEGFRQFYVAATLIEECERRKARRLAVHENLFRTSDGAPCPDRIQDFWEYVQTKFQQVEEVAILIAGDSEVGNKCHWIWADMLEDCIAQGLEDVRRERRWHGPRWGVIGVERFINWPGEAMPERKPDATLEPSLQESWGVCRYCKVNRDCCGEVRHVEVSTPDCNLQDDDVSHRSSLSRNFINLVSPILCNQSCKIYPQNISQHNARLSYATAPAT